MSLIESHNVLSFLSMYGIAVLALMLVVTAVCVYLDEH